VESARIGRSDPNQGELDSEFSRAPSISVTIPTKNSAASLPRCLACVAEQSVSTEIIVADDCSTDGTQEIAQSVGAKVLTGPLPLLEARYQAFRSSTSDAVLLLDSDQFLQHQALPRCLSMLADYDALVLEETSFQPKTWVSRLFEADRRAVHRSASIHLHPDRGSLLPRLFRRPILAQAFDLIPVSIRQVAVAQDHAIIAQCVGKITQSIGITSNAVQHEEMATLREMWSKYFRWGIGLARLFRLEPRYQELTRSEVAARLHRGEASWRDYQRSLALMALKSIPYGLGFFYGRVARPRAQPRD
jgi:cellulose synthase/poly-beta-1,6-N-acetylglucosamine synthase-like glycosyltransferase